MNKRQLDSLGEYHNLLLSMRDAHAHHHDGDNSAYNAYSYAAAECRSMMAELSAAEDQPHHSGASSTGSEMNDRIVAIHKSLADLWSEFRKSEASRRSLASDHLSGLADVRDECEKLRTNERQITEYVNKIRADLDAITTDKTCVVVLGQCVSELRNTLTNAQLAGQLEVNKINDRLAKLEEYCHTHYVDSTGACCPGEPVVGICK